MNKRMNKRTFVLEVLGKAFSFLKAIRCKMTSCCGCTSECGQKKSVVKEEDAESDEELAAKQTTIQTSSLV